MSLFYPRDREASKFSGNSLNKSLKNYFVKVLSPMLWEKCDVDSNIDVKHIRKQETLKADGIYGLFGRFYKSGSTISNELIFLYFNYL